jgi:PAS domain S-box-containing protein
MCDLPPEAEADLPAWRHLGIRSALTLPIETGPDVRHMIVIQTVHQECDWPDALVKRLRVLGELFVGCLERREMLSGLRLAEARVSLAADSAEAGLWTLDPRSGLFWLTERARTIYGYSPEEVVTVERLEASVHPDDRDSVRAAIDRALREPGPASVEYRIVAADGRERWIHSRGRAQPGSGGEARRLMGVSIDVTARRLAEEERGRTEARLTVGAELAGLGFYETDYARGVAYIDDRLLDMLGIPPERNQGLQALSYHAEHIHPSDQGRFLELRQQFRGSGPDRVSVEYRYLHPTRGRRWIHHLARVARRDATGRAILAHGVMRDITERKLAEEGMSELSRRLITAHEEERAMIARELHDDVTQRLAVLAIDVGRAELAATDRGQAEVMRALREEMARISEDVHSLAYQLHSSDLDELGLREALRTAVERLRRRSQVDVSCDLDPTIDGIGKGGALTLFRVAQEALNNLARHSRALVASVALRRIDDGFLLAVRDDGVGFDPADAAMTGRGLGLASMRERLRLANGTLDVESAPGRGTVVVAWVPAEEGSG